MIHFLGRIDNRRELFELYRKAKIYVSPSRRESYGLSVQEALINGTFCICSDIDASRSITNNFEFAANFQSEDASDLASKLEIYCQKNQEDEIESKAKEGRKYIINKYSLESICKELNDNLKA